MEEHYVEWWVQILPTAAGGQCQSVKEEAENATLITAPWCNLNAERHRDETLQQGVFTVHSLGPVLLDEDRSLQQNWQWCSVPWRSGSTLSWPLLKPHWEVSIRNADRKISRSTPSTGVCPALHYWERDLSEAPSNIWISGSGEDGMACQCSSSPKPTQQSWLTWDKS